MGVQELWSILDSVTIWPPLHFLMIQWRWFGPQRDLVESSSCCWPKSLLALLCLVQLPPFISDSGMKTMNLESLTTMKMGYINDQDRFRVWIKAVRISHTSFRSGIFLLIFVTFFHLCRLRFHLSRFGRYISSISSSVNPVVSGMKKKLKTIKPMVKHALMKNIPWTPSVSNQVGTDLVTTNNVKYSKKPKRPFPMDRTFPGNNSPYNNVLSQN